MDNTVRLEEFEKFYKALMSTAPKGYIPWLFPLKAGSKDPDSYAVATRAQKEDNDRTSWKAEHARLSYEECIIRIIDGGNIGICARKDDFLHICDSDSETERFKFVGMMCISRTRFGKHYFNWMKPENKRNIPTDKNGEVRAADQYVVAAGSFVKVTEGDLRKKFEEGSITLERIKELLEDDKLGLYTYECGVPEYINPDQLPDIFKKQLNKDLESQQKKTETEIKKSLYNKNDTKKNYTKLFDLKISDVCKTDKGRTSHPLHDSDTGTNWMISGELGQCWRHGVSLNAYQYLAVELGLADCGTAGTRHDSGSCGISGDKGIMFKIWCEAKRRSLIPVNDVVPYACLLYVKGKSEGILEAKEFNEAIDIVEREVPSGREKKAEMNMFSEMFDWKGQTRMFVDKYPHYYDRAGIWWQWSEPKKKWVMIDETDILIAIDREVEKQPTLMSSVKSMIIAGLQRAARMREPSPLPETCVQYKERIIDVETGEEFEASPEFFNKNPIPWALTASTETPTMDKIFTEWVGEEMKDLLYEIIAFTTIPNYFLHRAFTFLGAGSNGKSKFLSIIRTFIGKDNYCDTDLEDIANNRFESSKLYGKLIAFMGETNFRAIEKTSRFKKLTGQDPVSFEFKNKNGFSELNTAKLLISTNSLPVTLDKTKGFYRRWIVISFDREFPETIDILKTIPEEEYNNLATKSLLILRRLWRERKFSKEGTVEDRKKVYEEKSNPLKHFIAEECEIDENSTVFKFDFRDRFESFCKNRGYRIWSQKEVGSYMNDEAYHSKQVTNSITKNLNWAFVGLKFKKDLSNSQDSQDSQGVSYQKNNTRETDIVLPVNPVNPVMGLDSSNKLDQAKELIRKNFKNNRWILVRDFGEELVAQWLLKGDLEEVDPKSIVF